MSICRNIAVLDEMRRAGLRQCREAVVIYGASTCWRKHEQVAKTDLFPNVVDPSERPLEVLENDINDALLLVRSEQHEILRLGLVPRNILTFHPELIDRRGQKFDDDDDMISTRILLFPESSRLDIRIEAFTVYQFWVECKDVSGNKSKSENFVLFTPNKEKSIIDIILENFQGTFGWVNNIGK
jgi:hypothetical protein